MDDLDFMDCVGKIGDKHWGNLRFSKYEENGDDMIVFIGAFRKWYELLKIKTTQTDFYGEQVKELVER